LKIKADSQINETSLTRQQLFKNHLIRFLYQILFTILCRLVYIFLDLHTFTAQYWKCFFNCRVLVKGRENQGISRRCRQFIW